MKKKIFLSCMIVTMAISYMPISASGAVVNATEAGSAFSEISISAGHIKNITGATNLPILTIEDESGITTTAGTVYALELDNGFVFSNDLGHSDIITKGKFRQNVTFEVDDYDESVAYVTIHTKTDDTNGIIELHNIEVRPTKSSKIDTDVNVSFSGDNVFEIIKVGTYTTESTYSTGINIKEFQGGAKPTASGTAAAGKRLQIRIDDESYGEVTVGDDGTWSYTFPYKNAKFFKEGTHVFTVGYLQGTNKFFSSVSQEFEITAEQEAKTTATVVFTVGDTIYSYDGRVGYLDAAPFIDENGRTMLPLRAVAGTLGITADNIYWNEAAQSIVVKHLDNTIQCAVGSRDLTVNGVTVQMDTTPVIRNGVTFLPLRPLLNAFGVTDDLITWDANRKKVTYEAEKEPAAKAETTTDTDNTETTDNGETVETDTH